jgi:hypothetical protein
MTTQYELDNGILETLMSSASGILNSINTISYSNNRATSDLNTVSSSKSSSKKQHQQANKKNINNNTTLTKRLQPVLQVLNIQNIATPLVNLNSDALIKNSQDATATTTTVAAAADTSLKAASSMSIKLSSSLSSDRYLLILSDGVYYETTCLLLPNLNYLINESKLRKGSIIRLDRYELNTIPNGKVLVIEELTVLKNATLADETSVLPNNLGVNNQIETTSLSSSSSSSSSPTASITTHTTSLSSSDDNERKSIMNNNLAETLRSIGIIGERDVNCLLLKLRTKYFYFRVII